MTMNLPAKYTVEERRLQWRNALAEQPERRVVLGLGNLLPGDERLGLQTLQCLEERFGWRPKIEWIYRGVLGLNLLPLIESCSHLLVVDAFDAGGPPGTVIELGPRQYLGRDRVRLSERQVNLQDLLGLTMLLGRAPAHFRFIGLQPEKPLGAQPSQPVGAALPILTERVKAVIERWGLLA